MPIDYKWKDGDAVYGWDPRCREENTETYGDPVRVVKAEDRDHEPGQHAQTVLVLTDRNETLPFSGDCIVPPPGL